MSDYSWIFKGKTFVFKEDFGRLKRQLAKVLAVMLDGEEHSTEEIRRLCGSAGDSRLRDLRHKEFGSMVIDPRKDKRVSGMWWYRLHLDTAEPSIVTAVLEGSLSSIPKTDGLADLEQLRTETHEMINQFTEGKLLRAVWKTAKKKLEKDTNADHLPLPEHPAGMRAKQWYETLANFLETVDAHHIQIPEAIWQIGDYIGTLYDE